MTHLYPHELDALFRQHPGLRETMERREEEIRAEVERDHTLACEESWESGRRDLRAMLVGGTADREIYEAIKGLHIMQDIKLEERDEIVATTYEGVRAEVDGILEMLLDIFEDEDVFEIAALFERRLDWVADFPTAPWRRVPREVKDMVAEATKLLKPRIIDIEGRFYLERGFGDHIEYWDKNDPNGWTRDPAGCSYFRTEKAARTAAAKAVGKYNAKFDLGVYDADAAAHWRTFTPASLLPKAA